MMQKKQTSPRPVVATIKPYAPSWPDHTPTELCRLLERDSVAKLSFNENPYGPSPKAVAAMQAAACQAHLYHDMDAKDLRQKIADHYGMALDNVYIGNGGDETAEHMNRTRLSKIGPRMAALGADFDAKPIDPDGAVYKVAE